MSGDDWDFAKRAVVELANFASMYGLDDRDESIFKEYVDRCEEKDEHPDEFILMLLGESSLKSVHAEVEVVYDYKVMEVCVLGLFAVDFMMAANEDISMTKLLELARLKDSAWIYDEPDIIECLIRKEGGGKSVKIQFLLKATMNKEIVSSSECELYEKIHACIEGNPLFKENNLVKIEQLTSDSDIILIPI